MLKLIKLGAKWCGPCKAQSPIIQTIKANNPDIEIEEVDIDQSPEVAQKYSVMSIPTILFVNEDYVIDTLIGLSSEKEIQELIEKYK